MAEDPHIESDFGCYITVQNQLPVALVYGGGNEDHGYWDKKPPYRIEANQTVDISLLDHNAGPGAEGWFKYSIDIRDMSTAIMESKFKCPVMSDNDFSLTLDQLGYLIDISYTEWKKDGHPLKVTITVRLKDINITPVISMIQVPSPTVAVQNSAGSPIGDNPTKEVVIWDPQIAQSTQDNTMASVAGSLRCVAVQFADLSKAIMVRLESSGNGDLDKIPVSLQGSMNGETIFESGVGWFDTWFDCRMLQKQGCDPGPFGWAGDITWRVILQPKKQAVQTSATTRLEIYAVCPTTSSAAFFKGSAVPVGLLRRLVLPARGSYVASLIQTLFQGPRFFYDSHGVLPRGTAFGTTSVGGNLQITRWIKQTDPARTFPRYMICYDTAALAQVGLAFQFGDMNFRWAFMQPFGYIEKTDLIGWGECNNPFFHDPDDKYLADINNPIRTSFWNHAFVTLPGTNKIVDACCGPHLGTEDLVTFIFACIDRNTTLYGGKWLPGLSSDVKLLNGIVTLDNPAFMAPLTDLPGSYLDTLRHAMEVAKVPNTGPVITFSNARLAAIPTKVATTLPSDVAIDIETAIAPSRAHLEWTFTSEAEQSTHTVTIIVNQTHEEAIAAMQNELSRCPVDPLTIYRAVPADRAHGQYALESSNREGRCSMWIRGNIFSVVTGEDNDAPPHAAASTPLHTYEIVNQIQAYLQDSQIDQPGYKALPPPELTGIPATVRVGDQFTISSSEGHVAHVGATVKEGNLFPLQTDQERQAFTFVARKPGPEVVTLAFADATTYTVTSATVEVTVTE